MKLRRQQQIERELNGYRAWIDRAGGFSPSHRWTFPQWEIKIIISFIFYNPVSCEPWEVFDATYKRYVLQQKRCKYITTDGGRAPSCEPSAAQFWPYFFFIEEVMLAEENKNPGPSALDGKSTGIFVFPAIAVHPILVHAGRYALKMYAIIFCTADRL